MLGSTPQNSRAGGENTTILGKGLVDSEAVPRDAQETSILSHENDRVGSGVARNRCSVARQVPYARSSRQPLPPPLDRNASEPAPASRSNNTSARQLQLEEESLEVRCDGGRFGFIPLDVQGSQQMIYGESQVIDIDDDQLANVDAANLLQEDIHPPTVLPPTYKWFRETFKSEEFTESQVKNTLALSIGDVVRDIKDRGVLVDPIEAQLNHEQNNLEKVGILFGFLDTKARDGKLIHAFQRALLRADGMGYMLKVHPSSAYGQSRLHFTSPSPPQAALGMTCVTGESISHCHHCCEDETEKSIDILHQASALDALHDSAESFPQPRCHPETRTKIINDLHAWVIGESSALPICWLYGPAGAGKSAIMQTLCRRLKEGKQLGGSFFFKRDHITRGNARMLFVTLAYQLAIYNQAFKYSITCNIKKDPSSVERDMEVQLRKLIVEPTMSLGKALPLTFIIDGLDECDDRQAQRKVLSLIGTAVRQYPTAFRFLIASRPEAHIHKCLKEDCFSGILDSTNIEQAFEDVRKYLRDEFTRIHREHSETMGRVTIPWPLKDVLESLVAKSSGYFIYASTVIKFVDDEYSRPTERLALVQNLMPPSDSDQPFATLDQLYTQILLGVPARFRPKLCEILCVIQNFELQVELIDQLLDLEPGDVILILRGLHSLLQVDTTTHLIHVYHASFLDYLQDPARSTIFHVGSRHRTQIACLVLKALSRSIYHNGARDVTRILSEPKYGSISWVGYIVSMPPSAELVPFIRLFNPDWLWWCLPTVNTEHDVLKIKHWLQQIRPIPEDLIQHWEDYHFITFYHHLNLEIRSALPRVPPLIQVSHEADSIWLNKSNWLPISKPSHQILSQSPLLLRIFHALQLLNLDGSYLFDKNCALPTVRYLLNLSWDDMRIAFGQLRSIIAQDPMEICKMLADLPRLCSEFYSDASRDIACRSVRLLQRLARGDLIAKLKSDFCSGIEWGRLVRLSPHSNPKLIRQLGEFIPSWNFPQDTTACNPLLFRPIEFFNVLQWLKGMPVPQVDLIECWEGHLNHARDQYRDYGGDDKLEKRWEENLKFRDSCQEKFVKAMLQRWARVSEILRGSWNEYKEREDRLYSDSNSDSDSHRDPGLDLDLDSDSESTGLQWN